MVSENLIPLNKRTKEEQRKIQSKGGQVSGEKRRELRAIKDILQDWASDGLFKEQKELLERYGISTKNLMQLDAVIKVLGLKINLKNASVGDIINFLKFYSDYTGQNPTEKIGGSVGIRFIVSNEEEKNALEEV